MANDTASMKVAPLQGISKCWLGNSEPRLAELLDDDAIQAVMKRDRVTRQDMNSIIANSFPRGRARLAQGARVAIDRCDVVCYNALIQTSSHPLSQKHLQRGSMDGLTEEETNSAA